MVCLSDDGTYQTTIRDTTNGGPKKHSRIHLAPSQSVAGLFTEVGLDFHYPPDSFELVLQNRKTGDTIILNDHKNETLEEIGVDFTDGSPILVINTLKNSKSMSLVVNDTNADDDLLLGASASPTIVEIPSSSGALTSPTGYMNENTKDYCYGTRGQMSSMEIVPVLEPFNYVGLVNQAMTCYLNSLLQALYMTPEFRNALYKWEFDGQSEAKSIPFQLQKLFLNLQTSAKSAVETTELTRSFGWDLSEAWQQHDIQELCRVMFDALEQKFKDTEQANLINDLYEGKMLDYVKCLECGTEKSREDTFLDIPLPVRPFHSNVAYNSIEEALLAFVQPETLEENNQYHCDTCNKKCDAHKGLKFNKFPYLLTLHLKRFDFDYTTMHRIKLNDKVLFPEILNLNYFVGASKDTTYSDAIEEITVKCDDSSTTDSGSVLDDESCQGTDVSSTVNGQDDACQDEDEGIDVSSGMNHHENEKNLMKEAKGPYLYELFSIMIHSGSASGGHYYAYIKDFEKGQWFCFNDQHVSRITEEDIRKTYGGGPTRGYYSGAYSSSTNAYMLMYRQIDKKRNCNAMAVDVFPPHLKTLLNNMRIKEENDRVEREKENDMFRMKVYCWHPVQKKLVDIKLVVFFESTLDEAASDAHQRLKLDGVVALDDCRLVSYNKPHDSIDCSFDANGLRFCDISAKANVHQNDWLLEVKQPGVEFQVYKPGGVNMKVFYVNLEVEEVDGPTSFRVNPGESVKEIKLRLAKMLNLDVNTLQVVQEMYSNEPQYLEDDNLPMKFDRNCTEFKLYVSNALDDDPDKPFSISKFSKVIDRFVNVVTIDVLLPETDIGTLDLLSIPSLDINQNLDKIELGAGDRANSSPNLRVSPQPSSSAVLEGFGDQSNSEDSSLSDSDRTLVGDAPGDCIGLLSSSSTSPADQHMASPSDPAEDTYNHEIFGNPPEEMNWEDEDPPDASHRVANYYFKAAMMPSYNSSDIFNDSDAVKCCRVHVDKRMNLGRLKKNLEPVVGVPMEYFKVYRQYTPDTELARLTDTLGSAKDGDRLIVKLGRVLRKDEFAGKVFHLSPENSEVFTLLFDWVIAKGQTVGQVKKEILFAAKKQHMLDIAYDKSRLRKKNWKNPCKIFLDDQKFDEEDIHINNNWELFLQDLGEGEKVKNINQLCLFSKRWCPSTLTLTPFHEIVLDAPTIDELREKVEEESGIPQEYIDVAFPKATFPCDMNVLDISSELHWNPNVTLLESWPVQVYEDGSVFFYRDCRERLKELSTEDRKEITQRENARLGKFHTKSYSPRRERALKIYLDTSPNKTEETCGD